MTRCIEDRCNRRRLPHYSRCENHLRALLAAIFGPAEWRL